MNQYDKLACSNCKMGFGQDYGAAGNRCPACKNGVVSYVEDL